MISRDRRHRRREHESRVVHVEPPQHGLLTGEELSAAKAMEAEEERRQQMEDSHVELHREKIKDLVVKYLDGAGSFELSEVTANLAHWKTLRDKVGGGAGSKWTSLSSSASSSSPGADAEGEGEGGVPMERRKRKARDIFDTFDADGSATIDRAEMKNLLRDMCVPMTDTQLDDLITEMDADGSGEIDWNEFWEWYDKSAASAQRDALGATAGLLVSKLYNSVTGTRLRQEAARVIISHAQSVVDRSERRSFRLKRPPAHACATCGATFLGPKGLKAHRADADSSHAQYEIEQQAAAWRFLPVSCLLDCVAALGAEGFPYRSLTVTQARRARLRRLSFSDAFYVLQVEELEEVQDSFPNKAAPLLRDPSDRRGKQVRRGQAVEGWNPTDRRCKVVAPTSNGGLRAPNAAGMRKGWTGAQLATRDPQALEAAILTLACLRENLSTVNIWPVDNTVDGRANVKFVLPGTCRGPTFIFGEFNQWKGEAMPDRCIQYGEDPPVVGHEAVKSLPPGMHLYYFVRDGQRMVDTGLPSIPVGGWRGYPDAGPFNVLAVTWPGRAETTAKGSPAIDLAGQQICDDGLCALASAFSEISPSSIKSLNLRANSISCMGASVLAQSFHRQHALMSLDLSQNSIGLLGSERLAIGIKSLPLLLSLNLSQRTSMRQLIRHPQNNLGDDGVEALCEGVMGHPHLQRLDLSHNLIHSDGSRAVASMLQNNCSLDYLGLSYNFILREDMTAFSESLQKNACLKELNLSFNPGIGPFGLQTLSTVIEVNDSLTSLALAGCELQKGGVKVGIFYFCRALAKNHSLTHVDLGFNEINDYGALELAQVLIRNTSVCQLVLTGNPINGEWLKPDHILCTEAHGFIPSICKSQQQNAARLGEKHETALSRRLGKEEARKARKRERERERNSAQKSESKASADSEDSPPIAGNISTSENLQEEGGGQLSARVRASAVGYWTSRRVWRAAKSDSSSETAVAARAVDLPPNLAPVDKNDCDSDSGSSCGDSDTVVQLLMRRLPSLPLPCMVQPARHDCESESKCSLLSSSNCLGKDEEALLELCLEEESAKALLPSDFLHVLPRDFFTEEDLAAETYSAIDASERITNFLRKKKAWALSALYEVHHTFLRFDALHSGVVKPADVGNILLLLRVPLCAKPEALQGVATLLAQQSSADTEARSRARALALFHPVGKEPLITFNAIWKWYRENAFGTPPMSRTAVRKVCQLDDDNILQAQAEHIISIVEERTQIMSQLLKWHTEGRPQYVCAICEEITAVSSKKLARHEVDTVFHETFRTLSRRFDELARMVAQSKRDCAAITFPDYYQIARSLGRDHELTVYQEPDADSRPLGIITYDMVVEGLAMKDGWMRIHFGKHRGVWVQGCTSKKRSLLLKRMEASQSRVKGRSNGAGAIATRIYRQFYTRALRDDVPSLDSSAVSFSPFVMRFPERGIVYAFAEGMPPSVQLKVRTEPRAEAPILGALDGESGIVAHASAGDWLQVSFGAYSAAWILQRYQGKELLRRIVRPAHTMLSEEESPFRL